MKQKFPFQIGVFIMVFVLLYTTAIAQHQAAPIANASTIANTGRAPQGSQRYTRTCYIVTAAEMLYADIFADATITGIGFNYYAAQNAATSGSFKVYLQNTSNSSYAKASNVWSDGSTGVIDGMTLAADIASVTIPAATGNWNIPFSGGSTFTYTGGGLYIAFEYQNPSGTVSSSNNAYCNTNVTGGLKNAFSTTALPTSLGASVSNIRPLTNLAFYSNHTNDATPEYFQMLGTVPANYAPQTVSAVIKNTGDNDLTNVQVTLTVTGANSFTDTKTIASLPNEKSSVVSFAAYNPTVVGTNIVTVTLANDDVNAYNIGSIAQIVSTNQLSTAYGGSYTGLGSGTSIEFATKFTNSAATIIDQVGLYFAASGQPYIATIYDATGTGGTPGAVLWTSGAKTTTTTTIPVKLPVSPAVTVTGNFYVAVTQTGTTNFNYGYQNEYPLRTATFYFRGGAGAWSDFAAYDYPYKLIMDARLSTTTWDGSVWTNGVPTATMGAIIASSTPPGSFTCKTLTINSGIILSINSGEVVTVSDAVNNNGTFTVAPGGALINTLSIANVTLQQSVIGQRGWRVFANPFTTTQTLSSVASTNGIAINTTPNANSGLTDGRTFASNAWANNTSGNITANQTYALFIRGLSSEVSGNNYSGGPTAFTYNVSGTLNGASTTVPAPANTTDFIIVGNPLAAAVTTQALTNGSRPYYTYQIAQGGTQTAQRTKAGSWVAAGSNSNTTNTIPVLGVVAYQPSSTATYDITTNDINTTGTLQTGLFGVNDTKQLELLVEQNGDFQDKLFVRLDAKATAASTDNNDLQKFYNDNVNVYTKAIDGKNLAIDARAAINSIPVGISALAGDYNFKLGSSSLPVGSMVTLEDKFLNTQTELKEGTVYPFTISSDTASKGEYRFVLNFSQKLAPVDYTAGSFTVKVLGNITQNNTVTVQISGSTTPITIKIVDISGKTLKTVNTVNGINVIELGNTAAGMKLLQISNGKETKTEKVITSPNP